MEDYELAHVAVQKLLESKEMPLDDMMSVVMDVTEKARADERERIRKEIGMLRQWLNEKPKDKMVTNESIERWLGLNQE